MPSPVDIEPNMLVKELEGRPVKCESVKVAVITLPHVRCIA
jgi:hypothetical protein